MKRLPLTFIALICVVGCTTIPFQKTIYVPMQSVDPQALAAEFRKTSPDNFRVINTIVFKYNWNKFSAIGYIDVNAVEKTFKAVCINPMGVKLFELTGDKDKIDPHFVMEQFSGKGNFAGTVGEDIRRIYFGLTPSAGAAVNKKKTKIVFSEPAGSGILEYTFAGSAGLLVEKNYYEDGILNWRVSYYEYLQKDGKKYPSGIILENYKYGYSLIVKLKEIRV